jgi:hypothetical protein
VAYLHCYLWVVCLRRSLSYYHSQYWWKKSFLTHF